MVGSRCAAMPPTSRTRRCGRRPSALSARWRGSTQRPRGCQTGPSARAESPLSSGCCAAWPTSAPAQLEVADRALAPRARAAPRRQRRRCRRSNSCGSTPTSRRSRRPAWTRSWSTALGREVPLPGGGRLLIEPTAACVAIDVDGGGRAPLDVDLAAAAEIARQVRLRNLGGTIIVDFVDLPSQPGAAAAGGGAAQGVPRMIRRRSRSIRCPRSASSRSAARGAARRWRSDSWHRAPAAAAVACEPSPRIAAERVLAGLRAATRPVVRVRVAPRCEALLEGAAGLARGRAAGRY